MVSLPAGARRQFSIIYIPFQRARDGNFFDDFGGVQVQKVWRTAIIHSLMPNCQTPEFQNAKFG